MRKIPTLFVRNPENKSRVTDKVTPGCEWVLEGHGTPRRKLDGTAVMIRDSRVWKRYTLRPGKPLPAEFIPADGINNETHKMPGWVPVNLQDKYHIEALGQFYKEGAHESDVRVSLPQSGGTYELIGPKVQANAERQSQHMMIRHDESTVMPQCPRTFEELPAWLAEQDIEGIVWHGEGGRMAKIKLSDFGLERKRGEEVEREG